MRFLSVPSKVTMTPAADFTLLGAPSSADTTDFNTPDSALKSDSNAFCATAQFCELIAFVTDGLRGLLPALISAL